MPNSRSLTRSVFLFALAASTPMERAAAQCTWLSVSPLVSPPARWDHSLAYDPVRQRVVLFGGTDGFVTYEDTWEWDGLLWRQISGPGPSPRHAAAMAWDGVNGKLVLYGGRNRSQSRADQWSFDGTAWTVQNPSSRPPARAYFGMAYDSTRSRLVLYGGEAGGGDLLDTWEWDGTDWRQRQPGLRPPRGNYASLTYDPIRRRTVMLAALGETWEWDGTSWTPGAGGLSNDGGLFFDSARGRVLCQTNNQTWELSGNAWIRLAPVAAPPPTSAPNAIAFDHQRRRAIIFGGNSGLSGDTWEFVTDCRLVGPGHASGGLAITCRTAPILGHTFCVAFANGPGPGLLLVGPAPCDTPSGTLDPPLFCSRATIYPVPQLLLPASGDPALVCIGVPFDLALLGARLCVQAVGVQATNCLRATGGVEATLRL